MSRAGAGTLMENGDRNDSSMSRAGGGTLKQKGLASYWKKAVVDLVSDDTKDDEGDLQSDGDEEECFPFFGRGREVAEQHANAKRKPRGWQQKRLSRLRLRNLKESEVDDKSNAGTTKKRRKRFGKTAETIVTELTEEDPVLYKHLKADKVSRKTILCMCCLGSTMQSAFIANKTTVMRHCLSDGHSRNAKKHDSGYVAKKQAFILGCVKPLSTEDKAVMYKTDVAKLRPATKFEKERDVWRTEVIARALSLGIPCAKLDKLARVMYARPSGVFLPERSDYGPYITKTVIAQRKDLLREVKGGGVLASIQFDSTPRWSEAVAICGRFGDYGEFKIFSRLIDFQLMDESSSGKRTARSVRRALERIGYTEADTAAERDHTRNILGFTRDRAAYNNVAVQELKLEYSSAADLACLPHVIHRGFEHVCANQTESFWTAWVELFHSQKARRLFRDHMLGHSMLNFSATRWFSKWEALMQVRNVILEGKMESYLQILLGAGDLAKGKTCIRSAKRMVAMIQDDVAFFHLRVELE
eukprot:scaffold647_cov294-Pinguiococcus_pyrenoidosus.AAC.1